MIGELESYSISPQRGFLCAHDAGAVSLPGALAEAAAIARSLPQLLPTGRVRALLLDRLSALDTAEAIAASDPVQARMAAVHFSFMAQAWVWGEAEPSNRLPAALAIPMVAIADRCDQPPLLTYANYVLDNWRLVNAGEPLDLDNIAMIQHFLGGLDEAWFVLVHVAIESTAASVLASFKPLIEAAAQGDAARCEALLSGMAGTWAKINAIFDRMPERCDPYIYFNRVRPYIHGWQDNPALPEGVIYEGVERFGGKGQVFRGQTGSQSSIVPAMDALMGVGHAADPLKSFLDQLHAYRPAGHRRFIDDVRAASGLRALASASGGKALKEAYNQIILDVAAFRTRHLEYAASYIHKQGRAGAGNDTETGTGGTPFMKYLKKHRDETQANLLAA